MKNNDPISTNDNPQKNDGLKQQTEEVSNDNDKEYDEYYDKKDRDDEDMQEFNFFLNNRGGCKVYDIIIFIAIVSILAFVWIYVYQLPIPELIKILFGLDDTQYPTDQQQV